jgi:hypothetical protein
MSLSIVHLITKLLGQLEIVAVNPVFPGMTANSAQNAGGVKGKTAKAPPPVVVKKAAKKPAADFNPFAAPSVKTDITPIAGQHDIYFVFKNEKAKSGQPLMSVSGIRFNNEKWP